MARGSHHPEAKSTPFQRNLWPSFCAELIPTRFHTRHHIIIKNSNSFRVWCYSAFRVSVVTINAYVSHECLSLGLKQHSPLKTLSLCVFQVLRNDVMSHVHTVEQLNQAGRGLLETGSGDSPHGLQAHLEGLNERWEFVRCETERRQLELENNLSQVGHQGRFPQTCVHTHTHFYTQSDLITEYDENTDHYILLFTQKYTDV